MLNCQIRNLKLPKLHLELGRLWNELKADNDRLDELENYHVLAAGDKARYESEKAALFGEKPNTTKVIAEEEFEEELVEEVKKPEPPKPKSKQNGYQVYCTKNRPLLKKKFPSVKASEITKKLSVAWKSLSKDAQQKWKN